MHLLWREVYHPPPPLLLHVVHHVMLLHTHKIEDQKFHLISYLTLLNFGGMSECHAPCHDCELALPPFNIEHVSPPVITCA